MQIRILIALFVCVNFNAVAAGIKADSMEIEESVMVTIEENFGPGVSTIAEAINLIERKYQPFDNAGRTFAILDAYGNKMADGRMHVSMHISSEKVGAGQLILKTSKKVVWNCKFIPKKDGKKVSGNKALTIYMEQDGENKGKFFTADGSANPSDIFVCKIKETGKSIDETWKDGSVKEFIFIYSACGCPVHAKFIRNGKRTYIQNNDSVIFPDDPGLITILHNLMKY